MLSFSSLDIWVHLYWLFLIHFFFPGLCFLLIKHSVCYKSSSFLHVWKFDSIADAMVLVALFLWRILDFGSVAHVAYYLFLNFLPFSPPSGSVSLYNSGCPGTRCVGQAGLKPTDPLTLPLSAGIKRAPPCPALLQVPGNQCSPF